MKLLCKLVLDSTLVVNSYCLACGACKCLRLHKLNAYAYADSGVDSSLDLLLVSLKGLDLVAEHILSHLYLNFKSIKVIDTVNLQEVVGSLAVNAEKSGLDL